MRYIVIDVGSSFIKSAIIDLKEFTILADNRIKSPARQLDINPYAYEVAAHRYTLIVKRIIDNYLLSFDDVEGVFLATQMHGFVYSTDHEQDLYISWQDQRCLDLSSSTNISFIEELKSIVPSKEMKSSGVYFKPSLGICNLYAKTKREKLPLSGTLYTLGSFLIMELTGHNICHLSNAAPLGIVDIQAKSWNEKLMSKLGFQNITLPEIAPNDFFICGTYSNHGKTVNIYPDYGDQQVSLYGCFAEAGEAIINVATAAQVSCEVNDLRFGNYETRPYFGHQYIHTVSNMPAGRGLDVLVKFVEHLTNEFAGVSLTAAEIWNTIRNVTKDNSNGLIVDMSIFPSPDHPRGDRGSINHISPRNLTLGNLFAAVFQNMAETYWRHLKTIMPSEHLTGIVCAGGVSWRSPALLQAIERASNKECRLPPMPDESLAGFFRLALKCSGISLNKTEQRNIIGTFNNDSGVSHEKL